MSICKRYSSDDEEATEILNGSFLYVFAKIEQYKRVKNNVLISFKEWLRQTLLDTVIESCCKQIKIQSYNSDQTFFPLITTEATTIEEASHEEVINAIQNLSPLYRTVFDLYVIEQMDHEHIAKRLDISVEASMENLSKARHQLRKIMLEEKRMTDERMTQSR
jgi:RNA polymerase sigma factor (sigma-70 family)